MMKLSIQLLVASQLIALGAFADPFSGQQWGIRNDGSPQNIELDHINVFKVQGRSGQDIQIPASLKKANKKVIVAVLDTGVDKFHPDLFKVLHRNESECRALEKFEACVQEKDRKTCEAIWMDLKNPEVDQDKNGYPLDCSGWSILGSINAADIMGGPDFSDDQGHGTHVAGIIAAEKNNGIGVEGVSSNISILPVQVLGVKPSEPIKPLDTTPAIPSALLPSQPSTTPPLVVVPPGLGKPTPPAGVVDISPTESSKLGLNKSLGDLVARGVNYAIHSGAQVINFSLGWPESNDSPYLRQVIAEAQKRGIIIVAAAGNDSTKALLRPCAYEGVICVASHGPDGSLSHFSNYGSGVEIAAPGTNILSTYPMDRRPVRFRSTLGFEYLHGTSQASPMIAGLVAEMLAQGIPQDEIYSRLIVSARPLLAKLPLLAGASTDLKNDQTPEHPGVEPKYIMTGMADLNAALKAAPQAVLLPSSKEKQEILWDRNESNLTWKIPFKNLWQDIDLSQVSVNGKWWMKKASAVRPDIRSIQFEQKSGAWKKNEERILVVELAIADAANPAQSRIPSDLNLWVEIKTPKRIQNLVLESEVTVPVKDTTRDSEMEIWSLGQMPAMRTTLMAIDENLDGKPRTDYLAIGVQNQVNLYHLMVPDSQGAYRQQGLFKARLGEDLDNAREQVLARISWFKNEPGYVLGLFIDRSAKEEGISSLQLHFLNEKFQSQKSFEIKNEKVQVPLKVSWHQLGDMKTPAWVGRGFDPYKKPSIRDDWETGGAPTERAQVRFYYLDNDGKLQALSKHEGYQFIDVLDASLEQIQAGVVPVILAKNRGTEMKPSYVYDFATAEVINGQVRNFKAIEYSMDSRVYRNLLDTRVDQVLNLDLSNDKGRGTFWFGEGASQTQRLSALINTKEGLKFFDSNLSAARGRVDSALWVRSVYMGADGLGAFALTNSELQFHDLNRQEVAITSFERYTFYQDLALTNLHFPIVLKDSTRRDQMLPALFTTEASGLNRGVKIKTIVRDQKGSLVEVISPARLRFKSDQGCRPLDNPTVTQDGVPAMDYYCGNKILRMKLSY